MSCFLAVANLFCAIYNINVNNYPLAIFNLIAMVLCIIQAYDESKGNM